MAAFIQGRPTFGAGPVDFSLGFDMTSRKNSTQDYYSNPYPAFNEDQQSKYVDAVRTLPPAHQQHQPQGNHFTFNHSITHVNYINNRFQIDIPQQNQFHNAGNEYSSGINDGMALSMPNTNHNINSYFTGKSDMNSVSPNHMDAYSSPPALSNSTPHAHTHMMNMYQTQQPHFNPKQGPIEDYSNLNGFSKFPMNDHPLSLPNQFPSRKSDGDYSPSFYPNHSVMANNNNCLQTVPHITPMNKMSHIFPPHGGHKQRDQDVDQVNETQKCKNTIEGTKTSVRRFKRWYKERYNKDIDMNSVNRFNAPELLKDFFLDIRDTRPGRVGNEYEPVTLTTYRNGLRRYFLYRKVPPAPDNFDLTDKTFDIVNRHLVTKRDDLKRKGKGNHPNAIESITPEQLEKMWASGAIGTHAPRPLLRLQWWYNTVYHGVRGRMAHHDLTTDDFTIKRDSDGKLMMEYNKNSPFTNSVSMNDKLEPPKKKKFKGLVKETDGGERDPLRAFQMFKAHRPPGISSFYLTPKHKPKGNVWFNKVPMGKNSIGRIMREIKAIAAI